MDKNFEKMMALIDGKNRNDFDLNQVSNNDKKQLEHALENLFSGLTLLNWLDGGQLIGAWRKSLEQMRAMIFEITDVNPVVVFLRHAVFNPSAKWVNIMNTSNSSNEIINCSPTEYNQWQDKANEQINASIEIIRQKILNFVAGQPMVKSEEIKTNQMIRERENEREERVRTK
ncbi:hypothetical protein LJC18_00120 [Lachnospiraceae bacterium OttesenSCG-928-E19]|nr:hypothetical protein [Lachnospiraceae bacterium OttesenSCG-928-E19]